MKKTRSSLDDLLEGTGELAELMDTSRSALDRLLDPANTSVTLHTLDNAARDLGKTLRIELA